MASQKTPRNVRIPRSGRIRGRELPFLCRSLAALLDTGMPVGDCLRSLESQQKNASLRAALTWMRMDAESGTPSSESIRQFPSLFDPAAIGMLAAAEQTGRTPETLLQLSALLEARNLDLQC